jgi:two-component system, chemotaxis family, chemotaxis protein CheY
MRGAAANGAGGGTGDRAMRALVVDDSRAMRSILDSILGEVGFEVVQAADAEEAERILGEDGRFDLALVDWNLPVMSGLELVRALRVRSELDGVKLMMVTTETGLARIREALEAGADEYIMKPFDKDMLLEKLQLLGIEGRPR